MGEIKNQRGRGGMGCEKREREKKKEEWTKVIDDGVLFSVS